MTSTVVATPSVDPADLGTRERDVVHAAVGARSFLCTGAWTPRIAGGAFELYVDRGRWTAAGERARRGLRLAGGAALFNLRIAVATLGRRPVTTLLPSPSRHELLASVRMGAPIERPDELTQLHAVLSGTSMRPFPGSAPLPPSVPHALRRAVQLEGCWLKRVDQGGSEDLRAELGLGYEVTGSTRMLAVLGSYHDLPAAQLSAGQAGQHLALTAARCGLVTSMLPAALSAPTVRTALVRSLGRSLYPQMMLRIAAP
ncbi:hypothetical protein GCM10023321_47420 [Pseudonocardia eucalypti]|uniref:Urease accessory protein UreD n=1 Tax=Pseudonocardia eucalypti TaxID=648755 RepID=A0ABP9QIJ1_9PSEU|nr:hypothetical protein [Pseudonocardia eucalypti]